MPSPPKPKRCRHPGILTRILRVTAKMNTKIGTDSIGLTPCSLGAKRSAVEGPAVAFVVACFRSHPNKHRHPKLTVLPPKPKTRRHPEQPD